jgi:hypothetical protein
LKTAKTAKTAKAAKTANPRELAVLGRLWHSPGAPGLCISETCRNFAKLGRFLTKLSAFSSECLSA